jgi:hypothetical protein
MREHFGMTPMDMYEVHKLVHRQKVPLDEFPADIREKVLESEKLAGIRWEEQEKMRKLYESERR